MQQLNIQSYAPNIPAVSCGEKCVALVEPSVVPIRISLTLVNHIGLGAVIVDPSKVQAKRKIETSKPTSMDGRSILALSTRLLFSRRNRIHFQEEIILLQQN